MRRQQTKVDTFEEEYEKFKKYYNFHFNPRWDGVVKKWLAPLKNIHQTDTMSQEKTEMSTQGEQKKKRKRLDNDANDATDATTSTDISKEDLNENNLSKRKLKKKKLTEAEIAKKREKEDRAMQMAHRYLNKWKYSRNNWKFEKLKQIWLIDNLLSTHCISNEIFPVVLEYFEECKGMARETLVQKAMAVIKKAENEKDEEDKREAMKTIAYKRARQVLQTLHSKE